MKLTQTNVFILWTAVNCLLVLYAAWLFIGSKNRMIRKLNARRVRVENDLYDRWECGHCSHSNPCSACGKNYLKVEKCK